MGRALWAALAWRLRPWLMLGRVDLRPTTQAAEPTPIVGISVRHPDPEELQRGSAAMPVQLASAFLQAALARGDVCTAAFAGSTMAAFQWTAAGSAPHEDVWVICNPAYRYVYHTYVRPEYRGRRLPAALNALDEREGRSRGRTHTISFVETHNYPSIAFGNRLGNTCVGYAGYVRLFGRPYPFRSPGARRHGFAFARCPET